MKTNDKLNGADQLRDCVNWLNSRNEHLNDTKTAIQLLNEYKKEIK